VGSVRPRGRRVRVDLDEAEVALLISLISQVRELLDDPAGSTAGPEADPVTDDPVDEADALEALFEASSGPVPPPADPVLRRLLPDGYRNDDVAAEEFRRLTESGLRAAKRSALSRVADDLLADDHATREGGVRIDLDDEAVNAWLPALTDLRLVLGTRLDITEDRDEERESLVIGSPRFVELAAYDWLTWLQDAMVRAVTGD
jgi:Domain of unknown function (DUF2017)